MRTLEEARAIVARRYPETLTDSRGNAQRNIPHHAILAGHWDKGRLVQDALCTAE